MIMAGAALLALILGPNLWVRSVLARYAVDRPDYPGTGGEMARHLLDREGLPHVRVEEAPADHYDPNAKAVRLTRDKLDGRSLTAVVVAAHEVGHALQDRDDSAALKRRGALVRLAMVTDRASMLAATIISLVGGFAVSPRFVLLGVAIVVGTGLVRVAADLVTLPLEFDASFSRALPLLAEGYLPYEDERPARRILLAAALTYVARALMSVFNVFRVVRMIR